MKIKNIVFDFGAVLIDWNPHHLFDGYFGSRQIADQFLTQVCDMEWNSLMDAGKPFAEAVKERQQLFPSWADAIAAYHHRWQEMIGGEVEGMHALLNRLTLNGVPMYGLTNWSAETFMPVRVRYARMFNQLRGYVVSGEEHVVKPDPRIYQILLSRYGLLPDETLFVDDSEKNVNGALSVGMQAIQFQDATQLEKHFEEQGILPKR